ncbi:MAG TPA: M23 family metallopeptidase [Thermoanaerobaculia bacterium]|jgi:murein DD-endopeptidase MepM/ murein hydrolase activator NlpD|nr:M23 family metallopeptidase [Thermoanaerobaculia bacterium]
MQIQFHPASGRGAVRTFLVGESRQRAAIALTGALLLLAGSLWATVPLVITRLQRVGEARQLARELEGQRREWERTVALARSLRERALEQGDLLNRIAFLYALPPEQWPRILNPERALASESEPERVAGSLELYLRGLERGRALLASREQEGRDLAERVPATVPIPRSLFEPSAFFGPRTSPWTGEDEFFLGVDLAAPEGSPVSAAGGGVVAFAGTVRRTAAGRFFRLGNVVVVSHGSSGATVYGHLAQIAVRRGDRVARGTRLGTVGATGWAISPMLHWEFWRPEGVSLIPTNPLFATLDYRLGPRLSVEQMAATSAPGPLDPVPGVQIAADQALDRQPASPRSAPRRPSRRRRI